MFTCFQPEAFIWVLGSPKLWVTCSGEGVLPPGCPEGAGMADETQSGVRGHPGNLGRITVDFICIRTAGL